ncbi:hypothetical protein GWO43_11550 [candidate division KSB1 bacterium]|nr:hypothetical protein [candidate division KSB1 bacterium]NIT71501.1 hypothetical protein [candidate division KSB1 bacterium]NIX71181.1 hypothetical protein [candidate division KSB1 bacterium]
MFTGYRDSNVLDEAINSDLVCKYLKKPFDSQNYQKLLQEAIQEVEFREIQARNL